MSPTDPIWNPDAHLEHVYRRGRHLRNRRRIAALGGATLTAVALVAVVLASSGGAGPGRRVETAAGAPGRVDSTTTTVAPSTTGTPSSTGTVAATTGATTAGPRPVTTSPRPSHPAATVPRTTTVPVATTTPPTTVLPPIPDCGPSDLAYSTVTDGSHYVVGDAVNFSLVARNVSGHVCVGVSSSGIGARTTITGAASASTVGPAIACTVVCPPGAMQPGQSFAYSGGWWTASVPGTFRAVATRDGATGTAATFTVTAG